METEEDRRARLESDAATKRLRLALETEEERRARLEHLSDNQHLRLSSEAQDESSKTGTSNLSTYVQKYNNELARLVMGTIFLVS